MRFPWGPHAKRGGRAAGGGAPLDVCVGIQWGDEGKGRIVDLLARDYGVIARFGGGDNAGHSIEVGDTKLALRIVPSGVLVDGVKLLIGAGTVVSLRGLASELDTLERLGVDISRISVASRAHVVLPYHATLDRLAERARGAGAIGTTGRGIGPAYMDRTGRLGVTFGDLASRDTVAAKVRYALGSRLAALTKRASRRTSMPPSTRRSRTRGVSFRTSSTTSRLCTMRSRAANAFWRKARRGRCSTLRSAPIRSSRARTPSRARRARGSASARRSSDACSASRRRTARASAADRFRPSCSTNRGERLRAQGREFGVVTGRPRRCGWYDAVAARYAARINGLTAIVITKLDVLSGFERIGIVTAYRRADGAQCGVDAMADPHLQVEVEFLQGWQEDIRDVRRIADLPAAARTLLHRLAELTGVPIAAASVGPERSALAG